MSESNAAERLDAAIEALLADAGAPRPAGGDDVALLAAVARDLRGLPLETFRQRVKSELFPKARAAAPSPTVTLYLTARQAPELVRFVERAFGAKVKLQATGSAGGLHCEVAIGDSTLMIGGGGPDLDWKGTPMPAAVHLYVPDVDSVYRQALAAGAVSTHEPVDQFYGDREAGVKDLAGNFWYIATHQGASPIPEGLRAITPYFHAHNAAGLIDFLERALGAKSIDRDAAPDGTIAHAKIGIGDSVIEMGEAHGPYEPMPTMIYLSVPDVDSLYHRALAAGAVSVAEPADLPFGVRVGAIKDPGENLWYMATPIR